MLRFCWTDFCDLISCAQLTSLAIIWDLQAAQQDIGLCKPRCLWLPTGSNVQLQHLNISAKYKGVDYLEELKNLQHATQLIFLVFHNTLPYNLDQEGWPVSMPNLKPSRFT